MVRKDNTIVTSNTSIREVISLFELNAKQIVMVLNDDDQLLGLVTDGDIRRGILKGISLDDKVHMIMNPKPTVGKISDSKDSILRQMKKMKIRHMPIVDEDGKVISLETIDHLVIPSVRENWVVIMAGGLGTRLGDLTKDCPKPLLKIGGKPILETIIENLMTFGFHKFYLSVNYKAEMVEDYFGDGSSMGITIKYLREYKRLGTAGALSLIEDNLKSPIIVMNGDLLTKVNYSQLLDYHKQYYSTATMCVREYEMQVPYGVVKVEKHKMLAIEEKPIHRFFVNAGIYVLNPDMIKLIPMDTFYDMPTLFENLMEMKMETSAFPIREYWLDVGRLEDFERANGEYSKIFNT